MNMLLHGVENPAIHYRDLLSETHAQGVGAYGLILANPPFARAAMDHGNTAKDLLSIVKTKQTELLFLALFLGLLKTGGRAAVIVPDGVLFSSSKVHKELRRKLVEEQQLDAVISLPGGVFKPYTGRVHRDFSVHQDDERRHRCGLALQRSGRRLEPGRQAPAPVA